MRTLGLQFRLFVVARAYSREALEGRGLADLVIQPGGGPSGNPLWLGAADALLHPTRIRGSPARAPTTSAILLGGGTAPISQTARRFPPRIDARFLVLARKARRNSYGQCPREAVRERERWAGWSAEARAQARDALGGSAWAPTPRISGWDEALNMILLPQRRDAPKHKHLGAFVIFVVFNLGPY
jgi:hypothetical protein